MQEMTRALLLLATAATLWAAEPIRLHPQNPHYFQYKGRTLALITSGEHYGAVVNTAFDYKRYLSALAADRLNYTRIFGGSYTEIPAKSFGILRNTLAPPPGKLISPWLMNRDGRYDLSQWNPAYFARLHDFLNEAERRGIIVEITLFSSHYQPQHWAISPFHPDRNVNSTTPLADYKLLHTLDNGNILGWQERYVRKLVQETRHFPNVFYEIQNEPWSDRPVLAGVVNAYLQGAARDRYPNSIDLPDAKSVEWQKRVASWISAETGGSHLIAQNYCNFGAPVRRADLAPETRIVNFHYAYPPAAADNASLGIALGYDETGFMARNQAQDTDQADRAYLREAWNFMLSGGGLFNGLDYSFTVGHEEGTDTEPNGPGGGSPDLREGLKFLRDFLDSLPLEKMSPDSTWIKPGSGQRVHALAAGALAYAAYFDAAALTDPIVVKLPAGAFQYEWLDPWTGEKAAQARVPQNGEIAPPPQATAGGVGATLKITRVR